MNTNTKRYIVYCWDEDAQMDYSNDFDREVSEALDEGYYTEVVSYGQEIGQFDTEDEANECASNYADKHSWNDCISIYDKEEKYRFN